MDGRIQAGCLLKKDIIMKNADMIKNKIIHLTRDIMFEQGYDLVSMREIAKKASLNIAAVNYSF
jgi:AcrR family transcriptional regulator